MTDMQVGAAVWVCFVTFMAIVSAIGFVFDVRRIRREIRQIGRR